MKGKEQWHKRIFGMRKNLYIGGDKIGRDDERFGPVLDVVNLTYDLAEDPQYKDLMTATSHLSGETINRFCHVHQSVDDLHKKQDMTRMICQKVGGCVRRCMGVDAINAMYTVSYEADKDRPGETAYHENFKKWLARFQEEDMMGCCAQTDVKGDRTKRPHQQPDPDSYVHVVERRSDGIVVRGCKLHISEGAIADEILVVPTRALVENDADYAVSFAVPGDWEGVKQLVTIHNFRKRDHFPKGFDAGSTDSYVVFDDVFVPWDRVFLCGEYKHGGILALLFALFHRHSYSGCKPALGDLMLGICALAANVNGIGRAKHVTDKYADLIKVTELGYAAGYTASAMAKPEMYIPGLGMRPYGPGNYIPNSIYCNVGRCLTGESVLHELEILADITGGMPATFPYEGEFINPEVKDLACKYTTRCQDISPESQAQLWRYIGDVAVSSKSGCAMFGAIHGGGSPRMEKIGITSQYDIETCKQLVRDIAGMKD
ncbi:MAG: aromatic ring hydroxylase [Desulfarculaceae bacterium]|nr:aromatic ring hydroxylase [Desulfarculaceae bacterium]MCF8073144.1 aromatic ring hydroxylase [Desulfarculaceae bacterium]MCF8101771.1 aromatic ring hydroxylase [Desulfarculaceae bacterium]MCF8118391.1 aromatic ring hydroxylase [Desulfarculaceae bacterium]